MTRPRLPTAYRQTQGLTPTRTRLMLLLALTISMLGQVQANHPETQPNVLLIITDDQGFGDVRSHGNPHISTPVHDRLAASGARLDRFFVSPVCAPTRASLLTGRWHLRTGVHGVTRARETMRAEENTMAEVLRKAGYATGAFGKWHNGAHFPEHPNGQGFDQFYGFCAGHWNNYFDSHLERNGTMVHFRGFIIDRLTDEAIGFMRSHRDRPWFCYVSYNTPHSPWQVPDRYWNKYKDRTELPDDQARCAYAMVENIDDNMGRLLETLAQLRLADDTIVVFLSDNGANSNRYNAGMKGRKGSLHEGGSRVPCFIRWPGKIRPGTVVQPITAHIDLLPTLADLTGVTIPEGRELDGISLVPLLCSPSTDWPERTLFAHWGDDARGLPRHDRGAVRTDRWRAVMNRGRWELYEMQADPGQQHDVAPEHADVVRDLATRYQAWFDDVTANGFEPIPTQVGHAEVTLPGHEAQLHPMRGKGIRYVGASGWAHDYVTGWTDTAAYPSWQIDVVKPGPYAISLQYAADTAAVGNQLRIEVGSAKVDVRIDHACEARQIPSPDRVARKEVFEREWGTLDAGSVALPGGKAKLVVRCISKVSDEVMQLKSVRLTPVSPR